MVADRSLDAARTLALGVVVALLFSPPVTVALELALFALVAASPELRARLARAALRPPGTMALAFWLFVGLGLAYSEAPFRESFAIWLSWRKLLLFVVAMALFDDALWKRRLLWTLVAAVGACAAASYAGHLGGFAYYRYEVGIVIRNHATQGMLFAVAAFAAAALLRAPETRGMRTRLALGLASVLLVANVVFLTPGRSGYAVLTVLAVAFIWGVLAAGAAPVKRVALAGAAGVAVLGLLASSPVVRERMALGFAEAASYREAKDLTSIGQRVAFARNTLELIAEAPLIGYGTGAFETAYARKVKGRPGMEGLAIHDPHNQYLKIAAEHGLLGLGIFILFLAAAFREPAPHPYRQLAAGVLAAWCLTSLFSSHFSTFSEGRFIALWLGACLARD